MKKSLFVVVFVGIAVAAGLFINKQDKSEVTETEVAINKVPKAQRIAEALEWRYSKLVDPATGQFDVNDLYAAVNYADAQKANSSKQGALSLGWELVGPDNQGGRTRALIFDRIVPNKLWAGSVGGGLFKSLDGGNNWTRVEPYNGFFPIASIAQAGDGSLYVGTGEGLSQIGSSSFNSGSAGNGIYKSTDDGASWTHLPGTESGNDPGVVNGNCSWCGVNDIAISPVNDNLILAATQGGLRISTTAGEDLVQWDAASGLSGSGQSVEITSDGQTAFATFNGRVYRSVDVANSFKSGWSLMPVTGGQRADVAIAPSNENYVYASVSASNFCMSGLWRSIDGGDNWTEIEDGGAPYVLDPFNQPTAADFGCDGQGWYDHTIAVNPADENKVYIGGITLYTWGDGFGLKRADKIDTEGGGPLDSDYIHADKHEIIFDPTDPSGNRMLVGSDGGVTLCNNAVSGFPDNLNFIQKNKGYVTLQVYGMGAGSAGEVIAGTQDNGTQYIDGLGSSVMAAKETSGGDGVYAEISNFDPDIMFGGIYYGQINRSVNRGLSTGAFVDENIDQAGCGQITCSGPGATPCASIQDAPFVYPFYLMETSNVLNQDTTAFIEARDETLLLASGATQIIRDTLFPSQKITSITTISEVETIVERVVEDNPQYQATSKVSDEVQFDVVLNTPVYPGETRYFNDPYDAKYFVTSDCGIWMCTNPIQKNEEPVFYKISGSSSGVNGFDASHDGNNLYYVVSNRLYVVSGLNLIHQTIDPNGCFNNACTSGGLTVTQINVTGAGSLEGVSVDKNDPNTVLVTGGGFNGFGKVFRVENALSSPTIVPLQSGANGLPYMPIYDCIIDYSNSNHYIVGSELGIWTSDDAGANWTEDNDGMFGRMPVYRLRQEWLYEEHCMVLYAGTHGGGMFRTTSLMDGTCDPVAFQWDKVTSVREIVKTSVSNIKLYPNPIVSNATVEFELNASTSIGVKVFDMTGRMMLTKSFGKMNKGNQSISFNGVDLASGNYIAVITSNGKPIGSANFIKK